MTPNIAELKRLAEATVKAREILSVMDEMDTLLPSAKKSDLGIWLSREKSWFADRETLELFLSLITRLEKAEAALKPLKEWAQDLVEGYPNDDDDTVVLSGPTETLTLGHLRRFMKETL
jgi:hypothetical protein